jgi:hypothetical protein
MSNIPMNIQSTWGTIISTIALIITLSGGAWVVFQTQFTSMDKTIYANDFNANKREERIQKEIDLINQQRYSFLEQNEFGQFEKRQQDLISQLNDRVRTLEQTRPTTGELQASSGGNTAEINKLESRLHDLEQRLFK